MKKTILFFTVLFFLALMSCGKEGVDGDRNSSPGLAESSFDSSSGGGSGSGEEPEEEAGLVTAGEWNDLENWDYWKELNNKAEFSDKEPYWDFYTNNRVSVLIKNNGNLVVDARLVLSKDGETVWEARTDNSGRAELWIDLFDDVNNPDMSAYSLMVDGVETSAALRLYEEGVNVINVNSVGTRTDRVELAFVVDATGSMGDEMEFLKSDLNDVIQKVKDNNSNLEIATASVFYRDEGDDYVVKNSNFTTGIFSTLAFITNQSAGGGGDFPEAVHTALNTTLDDLEWSEEARTRIAFLLLDAPPHHESDVIDDLQNAIQKAAEKGIKIIPITASGIDKKTEFLMRFFSISTNSTYVFITNDSGIGNYHIEPSVGDYEVEFLNDLMVRLIKQYTDL